MLFLVVLALVVGSSVAFPSSPLRYAFNVPTQLGGENKEWVQFVDRARPGYLFGYEFPGRFHYESKDEKETVRGLFQYHDPNGDPVVWEYLSDPIAGFTADVHTLSDLNKPQAAAPISDDSQAVEVGLPGQKVVKSRAEQVEDTISPLLKQAAEDGEVIPVGSSPHGTPIYAVSPDLAAEAGGVSALAYRLGAIPVAAVHDAQARPSYADTDTAYSPVLVQQEQPEITLYTLEVPIQ